MTLKEYYLCIEGDYEDVLHRMLNEERVRKYVLMFLRDDSYPILIKAMKEKDYELAFRGAHTMRGVCRNLGFTKLGNIASRITEYLREKDITNAIEYLPKVTAEYERTIDRIQKID